jgi:quinol monooxygenase YgiN
LVEHFGRREWQDAATTGEEADVVVVEYIRYVIPEDRADGFLDAYREAGQLLEADERCQSYEVARGVEEPQRWVVRITWDSIEAHEQGFRRSAAFRAFFALVKPYFDAIEEMKHYEVHAS